MAELQRIRALPTPSRAVTTSPGGGGGSALPADLLREASRRLGILALALAGLALIDLVLGYTLFPAEPVHMWFRWRQGRCRRIIRVQHGTVGFGLILENARFGTGIGFQRVMAVQVVGSKVQKEADVGAKRFNQLELKTA